MYKSAQPEHQPQIPGKLGGLSQEGYMVENLCKIENVDDGWSNEQLKEVEDFNTVIVIKL